LLQEYTAEIERLRRDLAASRDKSGVYMAPENYTRMIMQLEQQQQEISQTLGHIKALKEEMDKKEASSTVLHCACSCQFQMSILLSDFQKTQNEQLVIGG
jgi:PHD/YefM family antitoxin component YafN of YafNO toxin-antitoxin module